MPAKVTEYYERGYSGFKFPLFEVDVKVDKGFSGGAVFHNGALCGLVAVSSSFEEKTWCCALWPLSLLEYDSELPDVKTSFGSLFDAGVIVARDWSLVKGRAERREDEHWNAYAALQESG